MVDLDAIKAMWRGFDGRLWAEIAAETTILVGEVVITTESDIAIATVTCDHAEHVASLFAGAGPQVAALVAEVERLRAEVDRVTAERDGARAEGRAAGLREALAIAAAAEDVQAKRAWIHGLADEDVWRAQARRFEAEMIGDRIKAALEVSRG